MHDWATKSIHTSPGNLLAAVVLVRQLACCDASHVLVQLIDR